MGNQIQLIVPSTRHKTPSPVDCDYFTRIVKQEFAKLFGGFTATQGTGGWFSKKLNRVIEENVTIVTSYTDDDGMQHLEKIRKIASAIATCMQQECVSVIINGVMEFISPPAKSEAA